jgi:hypothetical protein
MKKARKRVGRPRKSPDERKAVNFTFRSRGQMRDLLQAAADASDRSISEEIEFRLESSFRRDKAADLVLLAMELESTDERNWKDDPLSAETVRIAVDRIIAAMAGLPREHPRPPTPDDPDLEAYNRETDRLKAGQRVPAKHAEVLATVILRKIGITLPTGEDK